MSPAPALDSLRRWLDASPTPFHVVHTAVARLETAGWSRLDSFAGDLPAKGYHAIDGTLLAWRLGSPAAPYRILGAHTDSPNLRVQPSPETGGAGTAQLGIEIYGGVLLNSWLDRDLGIAGRVVSPEGEVRLFSVDEALARVPQLAIHLDREINERGLLLDRHAHLTPVWGTSAASFSEWLQTTTGIDRVAAFDAHLFDIQPAQVLGHDRSLLVSGRLDNQLSCWAAIEALAGHADDGTCVIAVLNDHEEVGSESHTGAAGTLLSSLLSIVDHHDGISPGRARDRRAASWCLSADNAHAVHPNYPERHDPRHGPIINAGPALKLNGNQRYATSARGVAHLRAVAESHNLPLQTFVSRNNMPCGTTIGPITATTLGVEAIDIGVPQWSMHSSREAVGANDPERLRDLLAAFASN